MKKQITLLIVMVLALFSCVPCKSQAFHKDTEKAMFSIPVEQPVVVETSTDYDLYMAKRRIPASVNFDMNDYMIKGNPVIVQNQVVATTYPGKSYTTISSAGLDKYNNYITVQSRQGYSTNQTSAILSQGLDGSHYLLITGKGMNSMMTISRNGNVQGFSSGY